MEEEVKLIEENYTFVNQIGSFGYLRKELVTGKTNVDGQADREMVYHRYSFADATSGPFEVLSYDPFGCGDVSGS